jgi:acyl-CoA synthetase (NDP forming)
MELAQRTNTKLDSLFNPRSLAIVGASRNASKVGNKVVRNLILSGYKGKVFPVNKEAEEILGHKAYKKISDINVEIDLVWIRVCFRDLLGIVSECIKKKVKVIIINSGIPNTSEGKDVSETIKKMCLDSGVIFLGSKSAGIYVKDSVGLLGHIVPNGNPDVSILTQSDALIESLIDLLQYDLVGISHIVGLGTKTGISESEILDYYIDNIHLRPKVLLMYLEELSDPKNVLSKMKELSKSIHIVVMMPRYTSVIKDKLLEHTNSKLQNHKYLELALQKSGVHLVNTLEELTNLSMIFTKVKKNTKDEGLPFVLSNSFFLTIEALSLLDRKGIKAYEVRGESKLKLDEFYAIPNKTEFEYLKMIEYIFSLPEVSEIILSFTKDDRIEFYKLVEGIERLKKDFNKEIIASVLEVDHKTNPHTILSKYNIPNYKYLENAIYAYSEYKKVGRKSNDATKHYISEIEGDKKKEVQTLINYGVKKAEPMLSYSDSKKILKLYGFQFFDEYESEQISDLSHKTLVEVELTRDVYESIEYGDIGVLEKVRVGFFDHKKFVTMKHTDLLPLDTKKLINKVHSELKEIGDSKIINEIEKELVLNIEKLEKVFEDFSQVESVTLTLSTRKNNVLLCEDVKFILKLS